jgi:hypothetical protein
MRVLLVENADRLGAAVREQINEDGHATDWIGFRPGQKPVTKVRN